MPGASPQRNTRNVWFCFRQGPKSHPSQVQPRWGTCPLLLPPHLLGVSPAQLESPWCSLRSGLQRPARGQPSTHGGYWHRGAGHCSLQAVRLNHSLMSCFTPLRLPLQGALMPQISLSEAPPTHGSETCLPSCEAELVFHALAEAETGQRRSEDQGSFPVLAAKR